MQSTTNRLLIDVLAMVQLNSLARQFGALSSCYVHMPKVVVFVLGQLEAWENERWIDLMYFLRLWAQRVRSGRMVRRDLCGHKQTAAGKHIKILCHRRIPYQ